MLTYIYFCTACHDLFSLPIGVIGRLRSTIVALNRHLSILFFFLNRSIENYNVNIHNNFIP